MIGIIDEVTDIAPADVLAAKLAGCLFRHELSEALIHVLRTVALGGTTFTRPIVEWLATPVAPPPVTPLPIDPPPVSTIDLSAREWEVLALVAQGMANKAIARELSLAEHTIERHLGKIYRKLAVTSRSEAGKWYWTFSHQEK